ncbi:MAG: glycoside hydrolase family 13 protein [Eubacteriales bacterium]|nr:glycoside hydrolase family 13 protein [Eubacteriales bacterium]
MNLYHDSRDETYRCPAGAQPCGASVRLFLQTDAPDAIVRFWVDDHAYLYPMHAVSGGFEYTFSLPEKPCIVWYYFICGGAYYGNARDNLGGPGEIYAHEPPSYQITVYDPAYETPAWMGDGVMMQIMPDRFFRGGDFPCRGKLHADWYEQPELSLSANGDNAANDFFGGDLLGIRQKLPYIASLGVTALYLNPVFLSPSNHKYDTSDYLQIDPAFGTEADLSALCAEGEKFGIRVILDGVFSHTGADSVYFNREHTFPGPGACDSKDSPYYSWYTFLHWPDKYRCWWGFDTLPNVDKTSRAFREFIIRGEDSVCAHWLRAGTSGWRLDVADELPMDFIAEFRARLKKENPQAALIGEVWDDPSRKVAYGALRSYCLGDTLDGVMNYPLRAAILGYLLGQISPADCARQILSLYENVPPAFARANMNLLGSHDKPRALSVLADAGNMEPDRKYRHPVQLTPEQYALGRKRLIAAWNLVCALPGMPTIYYGDEAGLTGMADPYCRRTYPWGREDETLIAAYRAAALRRKNKVLTRGDVRIEPGEESIKIIRTLAGEKISFTVDTHGNFIWEDA